MPKISDLLPPPGPITGDEKVPVVQGAGTFGMPVGEFVEGLTQEAALQAGIAAAQASLAAQTVSAVSPSATLGRQIADTAIEGYAALYESLGAGNNAATMAGWAAFRDAGSSFSDTTIRTGEIIEAVNFSAGWNLPTGSKLRFRLWVRPNLISGATNPNLNAPPGAAGDVVLHDTGLIDPPAGFLNIGSAMRARPMLPITPFIPVAGNHYGQEWWIEDGAGNRLAMATNRKTQSPAVAQRFAGFNYASTAATSWSNLGTGVTMTFGWGRRVSKSVSAVEDLARAVVPATPFTSLLTPMERRMIVERGEWANRRLRPLMPTTNHGLARLGLAGGVPGIDFGPRFPNSQLTATLAGNANWNGSLVVWQGLNVESHLGHLLERFMSEGTGFIRTANTLLTPATIRDFVFRAPPPAPDLAFNQLAGAGEVLIEHGIFDGQRLAGVAVQRATIRRCLFVNQGQNGINPAGTTFIEQCYIAHPGNIVQAGWVSGDLPHGDGIECNSNTTQLSVMASVIYMPATLSVGNAPSIYYPGGTGAQVNCIRHALDPGVILQASFAMGNILVGGNSRGSLWPRYNNCQIANVVRAFNRYSPDEYNLFSADINIQRPESGTGVFKNIAIFDEYKPDGVTPLVLSSGGDSAVPAAYSARPANAHRAHEHRWGVFDYDKNWNNPMTPKFIEMLHLIGRATGRTILDPTNNDLNPAYNLGNLITTAV